MHSQEEILTFLAYKGDLKSGLRSNTNICLWLREGPSLLQKFFIDKANEDRDSIYFNESNAYAFWEENRKDEYLKVKVKRVKNGKVELLDIEGIEKICIDENFAELDLEPYVSFKDRKKNESASKELSTITTQDVNSKQMEHSSDGESSSKRFKFDHFCNIL
jgi:hypothetical protein